LKQHLREFGKTTIIVSHDRDEIYKLCDRTMVMGQGEILVSKDTKELFEQPERVIAARLTGCKNISRAKKCGMHKVYAMDWGVELTVDRKVSEKITHVGIRAHDFHPADASSHDSENKIPVAVDREVRAPFEWTILFRNRENPKENMWMKMEREQTQIPQWVQVDPKRILLLEE
jgi:molybdate transport system ATP-binding protein